MNGPIVAIKSPSTAEIYWAVGFLDGEGSFSGHIRSRHLRVDGYQNDPELLYRLQELFGGGVTEYRQPSGSFSAGKPMFRWRVNSSRAAGVMMTMYKLLSKKRQLQIRSALSKWSAQGNNETRRQKMVVIAANRVRGNRGYFV